MTLYRIIDRAVKVVPKKKFGQNFLMDKNICANISAYADIQDADVLEIGPGTGNLTTMLLKSGARTVTAIELDIDCVQSLKSLQMHYPNLQILNVDAVKFDESELNTKLNIVANLPYNIGTTLLIKWLQNIHLFSKITIMLQKEVVDRIVARPGESDYSFLSVITQFQCYAEKLFEVPASAFYPIPKITSAVLQLTPLQTLSVHCPLSHLEKVTKAAFAQRRKLLYNNLKAFFRFGNNNHKIKEIFFAMDLKETVRAQELSIDQFCTLTNLIHKYQYLN